VKQSFWHVSAPLYWCSCCGVPTLEPKCGLCGGSTRTLHATPPKDLRPAFERDLDIVRSAIAAEHGEEAVKALIPSGKLVLLNKVSHVDQANEVVVDGWPMGKLLFNPEAMRWRFRLDAEGAARLLSLNIGDYVTVKTGRVKLWQTLNGYEPSGGKASFEEGRFVIVASNRGQAVGLAVRTASGLKVVKTWQPQKPHWSSSSSNLGKALRANEEALLGLEKRAIAFIKMVENEAGKPSLVSFSGGKDSLATLSLVLKAVGDKPLLFNDTGLEMPETINHVEDVASKLGLKLVVAKADEAFWSSLKAFGPPSRDYRWCCKVCKLIPISREVKRLHLEGLLFFVGQRRFESFARAKSPSVWRSRWITHSFGASPINDWSALHVWLYLAKEKLKPNKLYWEGFDRIGCWLCPACELAEFLEVKRLHPELWERWEDWLKSWAKRYGLPEAWITYGLWRWQTLPGDQRKLVKRLGLSLDQLNVKPEAPIRVVKLSGYAPCSGEYTVEAIVNRPLDVKGLTGLAPLIGSFRLSAELQTLIIRRNESTVNLHSSGRIVVRAKTKKEAEELVKLCLTILSRSTLCNACSSCVNWCEKGAIRLEAGKPVVNASLCIRCYACNKACPVANYLVKRVVRPLSS